MRCPLCGEYIPREDEELREEVCIDCKQAMFAELDRIKAEFNVNGWTGFSDIANEWVSETWNKEIHSKDNKYKVDGKELESARWSPKYVAECFGQAARNSDAAKRGTRR